MAAPETTEYVKMLTSLVAILNPVGQLPFVVQLLSDLNEHDRRKTVITTAMSVFFILFGTMLIGEPILETFGIGIPAFRVGGGLLILKVSLSMLSARQPSAKQTDEEKDEALHKRQIAVVPLAIPMLAGPGTISTMILYSERGSGLVHYGLLSLFSFIAAIVVFVLFLLAPKIFELVGKIGINIMTRIMGLIMVAVAVEFIAGGLVELMPGLAAQLP